MKHTAASQRSKILRPSLPSAHRDHAEPSRANSIPFLEQDSTSLKHVENSDPYDSYIYGISRVVYSGTTRYQNVLIADTPNWGRLLVLDGAIQSAEDDETLYHEMLVQPVMLRHPNPQNILILGGGEGATLREVLVHASVKNATMVDLDREVVNLCRHHLINWHRGAFEDKRAKLIFQDGRTFIENGKQQYDIVIVDIVDMLDNGPAQRLYTKQFYQQLKHRLKPGALVAIQGLEFSFLDDKPHAALFRTLKSVFSEVHSYRVDIPSFLSSLGFLIASDWFSPHSWSAAQVDKTIQQRFGRQWLQHIDGEYLKSCFSLCKETKRLLSQPGVILEDGVPFVLPPDEETGDASVVSFPIRPRR